MQKKLLLSAVFFISSCIFGMDNPSGEPTSVNDWFDAHHKKLADIALSAGDTMSNQEKLNHFRGDVYYNERKKIIKTMIEVDKIHPDEVKEWCPQGNVLYGAVLHRDVEFTQYLLERGINPDAQTLELTTKEWQEDNPAVVFLKIFLALKGVQ